MLAGVDLIYIVKKINYVKNCMLDPPLKIKRGTIYYSWSQSL
jgi:hypothetical protein